jgi:hypothetical protein
LKGELRKITLERIEEDGLAHKLDERARKFLQNMKRKEIPRGTVDLVFRNIQLPPRPPKEDEEDQEPVVN